MSHCLSHILVQVSGGGSSSDDAGSDPRTMNRCESSSRSFCTSADLVVIALLVPPSGFSSHRVYRRRLQAFGEFDQHRDATEMLLAAAPSVAMSAAKT